MVRTGNLSGGMIVLNIFPLMKAPGEMPSYSAYNQRMAKTITGRERVWQLMEVIGSGDAGEVLRVSSQSDGLQGVMKRPVQNVSGGTIVRQATQIETEGKILSALDGIDVTKNGLSIHAPRLLDQSIDGTSKTANLFIVSEEIQGKSLTSMLARRHSEGEAIPQNILLKVLSATLLLLEQAHAKGVIWNDVKTDHIFWQPESNTMCFIDWGNGFFLEPQPEEQKSPIWQDYQQLMVEGSNFLSQTSPNLLQDLAWPSSAEGMTLQDIKQLQLRVEYLEMYLSMRAIEYGLLFNRFSENFSSPQSLRQTLELCQELKSLGIEVESSPVFSAAKSLLLDELEREGSNDSAVIFEILNSHLGNAVPPNWKLVEYLLENDPTPDDAGKLALIRLILDSDWVQAAWAARELIEQGGNTAVLGKAIYSMRSLFAPTENRSTLYREILAFAENLREQSRFLLADQSPASLALADRIRGMETELRQLAANWAHLAENEALGEKFLILKRILSAVSALRLRLPHSLNDLLQKAMLLIREVYQAWNNADFPGTLQAIKKLFLTEPSLDYLLPMSRDLLEMRDKIDQFMSGPTADETISDFARELFDYKSPLTSQINQTNWQNSYNGVLYEMMQAVSLDQLKNLAEEQKWPTEWLFQGKFRLRPSAAQIDSPMTSEQKQALESFHRGLRQLPPEKVDLEAVRRLLPAWHSSYRQLVQEFLFAFSSIPREPYPYETADFPKEDQPNLERAFEMLKTVETWKNIANNGDWYLLKITADKFDQGWLTLRDLASATAIWNNEILPALTEIKQRRWNTARHAQTPKPRLSKLAEAQSHLFGFHSMWQKIEFQGLYPELLNDLSYHADHAQEAFFDFWQELQKSDSAALVWLTAQQQSVFSEINQLLLTLMRSLHSVLRTFDVVNQSAMARTRLAQNSAGDLVFTLNKIDGLVNPQQKPASCFRRWQKQYLDLLAKTDYESIRRGIQEIESIHPLLPWFDELVKRDAGYFDQPNPQRW